MVDNGGKIRGAIEADLGKSLAIGVDNTLDAWRMARSEAGTWIWEQQRSPSKDKHLPEQ